MANIDTSGRYGAEIVINGLEKTLVGLEQIEPTARRHTEKDLRSIVMSVAAAAAARVHSRSGDTAAGYRVRSRRGILQIHNRSVGAAILEFAGRLSPQGKTAQGRSLIETLNAQYGSPGRILWAEYDAQRARVLSEVEAAMARAEAEIQARIGE